MTQPTDITLANQSGANYRTEHNSINQGLGSTNKGSTAPSYAVTGMHWIDDSGTPWIEKVYDGSDWISIYEINATTNTIRVINQANGSVRTGAANIGQIQDSAFTWLGTSSGTNTITASATPAITAYVAGQVFRFIVGTTNTGAATLNINSVGAANIQFQGAAMAANSLRAGHVITVVYDGTNFQIVSPTGGTAGDILYYNASNALTRLPKGTDDQVLTLASGLPSWADASGGGGWVPIQTQTVGTAVASVDFTTGIDGTYDNYVVVFSNVVPATDNQNLNIRTGNGGSFDSGGSDYDYTGGKWGSALSHIYAGSDNGIFIANGVGNATQESASGFVYMYKPSVATRHTLFKSSCSFTGPITNSVLQEISGSRLEAAAHDRIQFLFQSGNITSGTFTLYGLVGA